MSLFLCRNDEYLSGIINTLRHCLPKLTQFSIGCLEDLSYYLEDFIKCLNPDKITHLGLASVKDDPMKYQPSYFTPSLINTFSNLKVSFMFFWNILLSLYTLQLHSF